MPLGALAVGVFSMAFLGGKHAEGFVAHEWGTFTSVQGGDGALLEWRPLETSRLPSFVYDWRRPGLNRQPTGNLVLGKGGMATLQRMETPVIYFYAKHEETVNVSVRFPQGLITEWYPQAEQIGPASVPAPPLVSRLDRYAHQAGVKPAFTFATLLRTPTLKDSGAHWARVKLLPPSEPRQPGSALLSDQSASHYFAARETDANYLQVNSLTATNPAPELEKFIFYRGVGNFATPLRVTMNSADAVALANTGAEPLEHLFVLRMKQQAGKFAYLDRLAPGEQRIVTLNWTDQPTPLEKLSRQLGDRVTRSLVNMGLYRREAAAMVNTWKDSWFAEEGLRVLYVLPRAWTDRTLPLTFQPVPRELVRVMVGRAEILTPDSEQKLSSALVKAGAGDGEAKADVLAELRMLGRFAEPAVRLAVRGQDPQLSASAWLLLQAAATPTESRSPFE
jgi:hypothetical protein